MYTPEDNQLSFEKGWFIVPHVDKDHELIKLADSIDWSSLSEKLSQFYCPDNGRPTKPARLKLGLLILKHRCKLSDRDAIEILKRDIYFQYFCDISLPQVHAHPMHHSTLSLFRKQIGTEGIKILEDELFHFLKKEHKLKGRQLVVDTTIVPSPIQYPTDVHLLEKCRRKAIKFIDETKTWTKTCYRTYKRVAQKVFITYTKIRHHTKKSRRKAQKKLLQFARRNVSQLREVIKKVATNPSTAKQKFLNKAKPFLKTAKKFIKQQHEIYKGKHVKERIVSLWAPHIRPMVRGKYPQDVEFGPKILLNMKNNFLFFQGYSFNNVNDQLLLTHSIESYKRTFGHIPSELAADRGFFSKNNVIQAKEMGIAKVAIQPKGKASPGTKDPPFTKRLRRRRCAIEAKISMSKRCFGLNKINYRIPHGEEIWIRLGLLAMNYHIAMEYG